MSWEKIIKNHSAIKSNVISKSEEREFLREIKKLESYDDVMKQLQRDAKQLSDAELGVVRAEQRLISDLVQSLPIQTDESVKHGIVEWSKAVKQHEESTSQLSADTQKVLVDPVKRLVTIFPTLQAAVKKRDQLLTEYNNRQAKMEKYKKKERTGPNIVKLNNSAKSLKEAQEEFERHNDLLMEELPKLYNSRIDYVMPSLQALLNLQLKHSGECYKNYTELLHNLDPSPGAASEIQANSHADRMAELCSLSIVATD